MQPVNLRSGHAAAARIFSLARTLEHKRPARFYPRLWRGRSSRSGLPYTGRPFACARVFSDVCGRAPMCWITSAAASAPSLPAFS
jgi:hypothetical protein